MTLLALVVGLWLALSGVAGLLFIAFVRGSGGTEASAEATVALLAVPEMTLPSQRSDQDAARERVG